jgi:hypothetical protein
MSAEPSQDLQSATRASERARIARTIVSGDQGASLLSFELAAELLKDTLPIAETVNAAGVRNHLHRVAERAEEALGDERGSFIEGCPGQSAALPRSEPPLTVGIDGCYVRHWKTRRRTSK